MRVFLIRHGTPNPEEEDPQRHLSRAGLNETKEMGRFIGKIVSNRIKAIHHSPKTRARETAEIIGGLLGVVDFVEDGMLVPMAEPGEWAYKLSQARDDVVLVGHLPHLERLASQLLTGNPDKVGLVIKPAGALCLERDETGVWGLLWMVAPGVLRIS